jgi:hypothetical protein
MIIVTGTKRSGTSMWMQTLQAAGVQALGSAFPRVWEESIKDANPRGFFESRLRNGVFYRTNPDPKTGAFLTPKATRKTAVKVFIPGLVRSDMAYLHRVIGSVRPWRAYSQSLRRLYDMEDVWLVEKGDDPETGESRLERARKQRATVPAAVEWWFENYELIRDVATRRYSFHIVSYDAMLANPAAVLEKVLPWLGVGEIDSALAAVEPALCTQPADTPDPPETADLAPEAIRIFDDYYAAVHDRGTLPKALISDMNVLQKDMEKRWKTLGKEREVR